MTRGERRARGNAGTTAGRRARGARALCAIALARALVGDVSRYFVLAQTVSTGAPLVGATNGAAQAVLDFASAPGGRCSPNDDSNTMACEKLEPPSTKNYASFDFYVNDVNGARCDKCGRECSLDGAAWAYCGATPVWYFGLSYGQHQFKVRGLGGDNVAGTAVVYDWMNEEPLKVEWDSGYSTPSSYLNSNAVLTFHLASSRPSSNYVQFEYSTTNDYIKTFTRLSIGVTSVSVTPSYGSNRFTFRAISIESFTGKSLTESSVNEIELLYVADNVNPSLAFVSGLANGGTTQKGSMEYVISALDVDPTNGYESGLATLDVQLFRLDNGATSPSPLRAWTTYHTFSGAPVDKNVTVTLTNIASLADTTYKLEIRATDLAGNVATTIGRTFVVQLSSLVNVPDSSGLSASTTERLQTTSGAIKLASQPSDGSLVPVAYEVSAIVGGTLVLESATSVALANNTLVTASDALNGFRFTPTAGFYTNDQYASTFGFDLKPSTSTSDLSQVVNLPAHSTITVTATNDPPVVSVTAHYKLTPIHVSDGANIGTVVRDILDANVIDYDYLSSNNTVPYGFAVVGADETRGAWQFSTNGGSSWTNFNTAGALSTTNALMLTATTNDRVRFVPTATTLQDQFIASFAFKGWDGTTSEATGATGIDITTSGHTATTGSISVSTVTATILVRGLSHSLFEQAAQTTTASSRQAYSAALYSCPPTHRRSIRIPVAATSSTSSSCAGTTSTVQPKIKASSALTVSPPWTIEAWVRRDAWLSEQTLFQNPSDLSAVMLEMSDASGKVGVVPPSGVSGGTFNYAAPLGTWVHLAFVMYENNHPSAYSAPGANLRLIVNGVFHSEITNVGFAMPHGIIGGSGLAGFSIDEVRFWSIARSTEDIYTNMNRFVAGTETGLVSYVPFDAGCGSTVVDRDSGSSTTWTLVSHEWIDARIFSCASLTSVSPASVNLYNTSNLQLTGERFTRPALGWGSSSVASFDGTNAVCIFGSSTIGNMTTVATVVNDGLVQCAPPDSTNGIAVVTPVFCDYSLGCCTSETPIDYYLAASRPYDSNYVSYGVNTPPMYDQPALRYSVGEITSVMPSTIDWALGAVVTLAGYGFSTPMDTNFGAQPPKCVFRARLPSKTAWATFHVTDAAVLSDSVAKCEYPGSAVTASLEARYSVEVALAYFYDHVDSIHLISNGWITVVVSSYTLYTGLDEPLTEISDLGGSVVSITAIYTKSDTAGEFADHTSGRVSSLDVACAFGTVHPVSARYNASETFECVAPAAPRAVPTDVPLSVTLFASSMFTSYSRLELLTQTGDISYVAQPVVSAIWPLKIFSVATNAPNFQVIGSNFPSSSTTCQLNNKYYSATWSSASRVQCNTVTSGGASPGFQAVYVGNNLLKMDEAFSPGDAHVMIRDDVYVGAVVSGGAAGPLYGGWALTVSGSGFLPGDGCSLHAYPGELNGSGDDPTAGEFVSSALMRCLAPKVEENSVNWDLTSDGGGWATHLVARLAIQTFSDALDNNAVVMKVVDGINNVSAVANLYATMTSAELISTDPVYLNVDGGTSVAIIAKNGTASLLSTSCRFGTIQVLADWGWSNTSSTTRMRCVSPSFGAYSTNGIRLSVSQGDPGHHGETVVSAALTMMRPLDDLTSTLNNGLNIVGPFSSVPSAQLALYECYIKGDRNFVTGSFELASSQNEGSCSLRQASMNLVSRSDFAFYTTAIAIRGGEDVALPITLQYIAPPIVSSVTVSARPPPYGYRPAFATSNCTTLEDAPLLTYDNAHGVYEGRPQTPYEVEEFALSSLPIFGGAWWHVSNAIGTPVNVYGRFFRSPQDGGDIRILFQHAGEIASTSAHFVSSALVRVEVPIDVDAEHETEVRASVDDGASWSSERFTFMIPELDYVNRDLQTVEQGCAA